jgi:hypothetical protein
MKARYDNNPWKADNRKVVVSWVTSNSVRFGGPDAGRRIAKMTQTATMTTEPQRLRALERANEVRLARAELKRRIAEGDVSVAELLLDPPAEAGSWATGDLLMSQRRWGSTRCRKFLVRNHIMETKPVGALTERQRRLLAGQLESCNSRELELVGA